MNVKVIHLKLDPSLHKELKETCKIEGITMQQFIVSGIHRELEFAKLWTDPMIPDPTGDHKKDIAARKKAIDEAKEINIALLLHK
jgi:hypothetical protein